MILLDNVDTDTVSPQTFTGSGGSVIVFIRADDFGGGTVTLSTSPPSDPGNRLNPLNNGTFTADCEVNIEYLPSGTKLSAELAGSTSPVNVFVEAI